MGDILNSNIYDVDDILVIVSNDMFSYIFVIICEGVVGKGKVVSAI